MGVSERLYQLATSAVGRHALARLGKRVHVGGFDDVAPTPRHPLVVCITIDVEGGYVAHDEMRISQARAPESFEGFVHGIPNTLDTLAKHHVKATFFVSPHALSAKGSELGLVERALAAIVTGGHEVGLDVHPTSDRAIAERLGRSFPQVHAGALEHHERLAILNAGRDLLEGALRVDLASSRWAHWALDARSARTLAEAGFRIDSSAVPGLRDRKEDPPRFDWSTCTHRRPWEIAPGIVEMPIATFQLLGATLRADPRYGSLLDAAFDTYLRRAPRRDAPFPFVVMTRTTEATHRDGSTTKTLFDLDRFLSRACSFSDVVFAPLAKADTVSAPL